MGKRMVNFQSDMERAFSHMAGAFFETLARHGTTEPFRNRMFDFRQVNELVGTPEMLETGRRYGEDRFETPEG